MTPSKAAALRFLAAHVGRAFETSQTGSTGREVWNPGPRTLALRNARSFTLDGSIVAFGPTHTVTALDERTLTVEWRAGDGSLIHTTTYTLVRDKPGVTRAATPEEGHMTTAASPGTSGYLEAAMRYQEACAEYEAAVSKLSALNEAAEHDESRYREAHDYRHYDYAATAEETLHAARHLLNLLGLDLHLAPRP